MQTIEVLGVPCRIVTQRVPYNVAHPDEEAPQSFCDACAVVERPDTKEHVLVWRFRDTGDATVSRHDPSFRRHRDSWPKTT